MKVESPVMPEDELRVLERRARELRIDPDELRRALAAAAQESARGRAELASLDTPALQRARLLVLCTLILAATGVLIALFALGVLP